MEDVKKIKKLIVKLSNLRLEKKMTVQWMTRLFDMLLKVRKFKLIIIFRMKLSQPMKII